MKRYLAATAMALTSAIASAAPVLSELSPTPQTFVYGNSASSDYYHMSGTGFGDVTAQVFAVDLLMPPVGGSTSGCEASDFAGFTPGSIALIQRGACTFAIKATHAAAAGALGVLIFNEGNAPGRFDVISGTLGSFSPGIMVFGTSHAVGTALFNGVVNGSTGVTVRMALAPEDLIAVPEPGSLALLGLGLTALALGRRRSRRG